MKIDIHNRVIRAFCLLIAAVIFSGNAFCAEQTDALILLNDNITINEAKALFYKNNIHANLFMIPGSVYVNGERQSILSLKGDAIVKDVFLSGAQAGAGTESFTKNQCQAVNFFQYNENLKARAEYSGGEEKMEITHAPPRDLFVHSKRESTLNSIAATSFTKPADFYFTSEYLIGDVSVAIVIPESDGSEMDSTEDWDEARIEEVVNEIQASLIWWSNRIPGQKLSFYVFKYPQVTTKYEIINMTAGEAFSDESLWVDDIMVNLGYSDDLYPPEEYDYMDKVYAFNNDLRNGVEDEEVITDWAITFFVIDSFNDDDGKFANDFFALTYLGGPYTILTYDNENYGIEKMREVALHEMAHQFYALDEYYIAYEPCTSRSGYLAVENQNSEFSESSSCVSDEVCVMRDLGRSTFPYDTGKLCDYTRGQLGLDDMDEDGVLDPVGADPVILLDPYEEGTMMFAGSVSVKTYPNSNPLMYPNSVDRLDITVSKIVTLQYRLGEEGWVDIEPDDGELWGRTERFAFIPVPIQTGYFTLEIKAVDSMGNETKVVAATNLYIESTAGNSVVSLCFIASASYDNDTSQNIVLEALDYFTKSIRGL